MKVIFLDMDGVLNHAPWEEYSIVDWPFNMFEPSIVEKLNKLTDDTGANIVLSSTWRLGRVGSVYLTKAREVIGITAPIIAFTDVLYIRGAASYQIRELEISTWLKQHPEVTNFVSLDDMPMGDIVHNVKCDPNVGLTDDNCAKAKWWLDQAVERTSE